MTAPDEEQMMIMHRQWMDGHWHPWVWFFGSAAMAVLWGGAIWAVISLFRRGNGGVAGAGGTGAPRASAEQILAERLARGEIDADEYRSRLEALRATPPTT